MSIDHTWLTLTSYSFDSSASVLCSLMASNATCDLNFALYFFLGISLISSFAQRKRFVFTLSSCPIFREHYTCHLLVEKMFLRISGFGGKLILLKHRSVRRLIWKNKNCTVMRTYAISIWTFVGMLFCAYDQLLREQWKQA